MGCTDIPLALSEHSRLEGLTLVNPSLVLAAALARHAYGSMGAGVSPTAASSTPRALV